MLGIHDFCARMTSATREPRSCRRGPPKRRHCPPATPGLPRNGAAAFGSFAASPATAGKCPLRSFAGIVCRQIRSLVRCGSCRRGWLIARHRALTASRGQLAATGAVDRKRPAMRYKVSGKRSLGRGAARTLRPQPSPRVSQPSTPPVVSESAGSVALSGLAKSAPDRPLRAGRLSTNRSTPAAADARRGTGKPGRPPRAVHRPPPRKSSGLQWASVSQPGHFTGRRFLPSLGGLHNARSLSDKDFDLRAHPGQASTEYSSTWERPLAWCSRSKGFDYGQGTEQYAGPLQGGKTGLPVKCRLAHWEPL